MIKFDQISRIFILFKRAFGEQKWQITSLIFLSFFSGALEGIGINAVIPLASFVQKGQLGGVDMISRAIEKFFFIFHIPYTLKYLIIFIILLFVIKAVLLFFISYIATGTVVEFENRTRKKLFSRTFYADWAYLAKHKLGHMDQILTTYVSNSSAPLFYFGGAIVVIANLAVYTFLAINISIVITLLALATGSIAVLFFRPFFRRNEMVSRELSGMTKEFGHFVNESVLGMKTIKAMFSESQVVNQANVFFDRFKWLNLKITVTRNITNVLLEPVGVVFILSVFSYFYLVQQNFNFGTFAVIVYAIHKIFSQAQLVQSYTHSVISAIPFLESVLNYENEVAEHEERDLGKEEFLFTDKVIFKNIHFSYQPDHPILSGVEFAFKKGEITGLIGPSGAGKTTIVDLLLRLYIPQGGEVLLDEKNVSNIKLSSWRKNISYVSQEIFLLNDTIENNIKFYSDGVTEKDMVEVARMANIFDFINSLPEKFQTVVGERGVLLSGGQRQRIILARALARRPQILVLDEATSALDNESEILIQKAIESLKGRVTVLAIAHRLSTVKASDKLIVLDGGKIIEEGSPEELLKNKDSYFFKVYNLRT